MATSDSTGRLRREVGLFRERIQALSAILQDLQGGRSPQSVLRGAQNMIASTVGADGVWVVDGRAPLPRTLVRTSEPPPALAMNELRRALRSGRLITVGVEDGVVYLAPLQSGTMRWGVIVVRVPTRHAFDAEALRFLGPAAGLLGGAAALWDDRKPRGYDLDSVVQGWLSLTALPSRLMLLLGEKGTGKATFAERLHDRYVGGGFSAVDLQGGDDDEAKLAAVLRRPGLRSLYVHDVVSAAPAARALLLRSLANENIAFFLGSSQPLWPIFPDELVSRAGLVTVRLPALRERAAEIAGLVQAGLAERGLKVRVSNTARKLLAAHAWPGNYGELAKFIAQAEQALRLEGTTLLAGSLTRHLLEETDWIALPRLVDSIEAHVLGEALRRFDGNRAAVARAVDMTPRQVGYKCAKYNLE